MTGLITAIRTLTAIPCPGKDSDEMSTSLPWFPIVGLFLGTTLFFLAEMAQKLTHGRVPALVAAFIVLGGALLTRGMHLDGLADWADGFWGGMNREKVLAIMKDSCIGSFGSIALITTLLIKFVCITQLLTYHAGTWIIAAMIISRTAQVNLAALYPYARQTDGTGAPFIRNAGAKQAKLASAIAVIMLFIIFRAFWMPITTLSLGWIISILLGKWSYRRIGGITGDIIGAGSELTETVILIAGIFYS